MTGDIEGERELWAQYLGRPDGDARNALFFRYAPWSRAVARDVYRRIRVPQMDWADFAQNATVGLLEAMGRYDPDRGVDFTAYAKPRVRGAVFNGVRSFLADKSRREDVGQRLQDRLESVDDRDSGDPLEQMVNTIAGLGLGLLMDSHAFMSEPWHPDASEAAEQSQMERMLDSVLDGLPEKEQLVLILHYRQHLAFVDIARMMGLTKGRISQIHKSGITRCRQFLQGMSSFTRA